MGGRRAFLEQFGLGPVFGEGDEFFRKVFDALMSQEEEREKREEEFDKAVTLVDRAPEKWPDDFRYELKSLQKFRKYYGRRKEDYTPEQRFMMKAYDKHWTEELVRKLLGLKSERVAEEPPELEIR